MNIQKINLLVFSMLMACISLKAQNDSRITAFVGVNVIPMDRERVLLNQTVLVQDGKIKEMGDDDQLKVPAGATVIQAKGSFLMPGMTDMHAHLPDGAADEISLKDYLALNVLRGVTSIRTISGDQKDLTLRDSIRRNLVFGPDLFVGSPFLPGGKNFNAQKAAGLLDQYKKDSYQFISYQNPMKPALYDSIMHLAKEKGFRVAGPCPEAGLEAAANAGQGSVEQMDAILQEYRKDSVWFTSIINSLVKNKVFVCPTFQTYLIGFNQLSVEQLNNREGTQYLSMELLKKWKAPFEKDYALHNNTKENKQKYLKTKATKQRDMELDMRIIKNMNDDGVALLLSPGQGPFIIPGYGLMDECRAFVAAGISPFMTLKSATANAASFFGEVSLSGTVATDKRADLILLEDNPLNDIENLEKISGVMLRGHWYSKDDLDKMKTAMARKNQRDTEESMKDKVIRENSGPGNEK